MSDFNYSAAMDAYLKGFNDCSGGIDHSSEYKTKYEQRAYIIGWSDYIVGDDVRSVDYQSDEQIIKRIKQ